MEASKVSRHSPERQLVQGRGRCKGEVGAGWKWAEDGPRGVETCAETWQDIPGGECPLTGAWPWC